MLRLIAAFIAIVFSSSMAYALQSNVLVSVGDLTAQGANKGWQYKICEQIYAVANSNSNATTNVACRQIKTENFFDKELQSFRGKYEYHIRILKDKNESISMQISNWNRHHKSDFETVEMNFSDTKVKEKHISKDEALLRSIYNFFVYSNNEDAFKMGLLMNGLSESTSVSYDAKNNVFLNKLTLEPVSINQAVSNFENESQRKINYLRAGIELGVLFSAGMAIYYKNLVYNQKDFDFTFTEGLKKKFINGQAIRFDDNDKFANYGHEIAGVLYYQVARTNGANQLEAFLVSFASSALWETLEYHEVFSINDQIMTPIGGYVIGEAMYQTSCALIGKGGIAANALAYALNPTLAINHGVDQLMAKNRFASQTECEKPRWSEISLKLGLEKDQKPWSTQDQQGFFAGLQSEVINIPEYGQIGKSKDKGFLFDSSLNRLIIELNKNSSAGGGMDLRIIAQTAMTAYYNRNVEQSKDGQLNGYDFALGVGSGSTWNDRGGITQGFKGGPDPKEDFYGTIDILGPVAMATFYHKGWTLRLELGFYGDFTMVKSYALEKMRASESLSGTADVVSKRGYYWGLGTTGMINMSAEYGNWKISYSGQHSSTRMIHGRARNESSITHNLDARDDYDSDRITIGYRLTRNLRIEFSKEWINREGSIDGRYESSGKEERVMGTLVYLF